MTTWLQHDDYRMKEPRRTRPYRGIRHGSTSSQAQVGSPSFLYSHGSAANGLSRDSPRLSGPGPHRPFARHHNLTGYLITIGAKRSRGRAEIAWWPDSHPDLNIWNLSNSSMLQEWPVNPAAMAGVLWQ